MPPSQAPSLPRSQARLHPGWLRPLMLALPLLVFGHGVEAAPRVVDSGASQISFSVKQMGVAVDGRFTRYSASIDLDTEHPEQSKARIEVDISSLDTGTPEADAIAIDTPWLNANAFPKAVFESTAVRSLGPNRYQAEGQLTIRGSTRAISVPFTTTALPDGRLRAQGEFTLNRTDFGIGGGEWNQGDLVADAVPVRFNLVLSPAPSP
ncbi:YceI family protein [Sinimarinibacterium sp. CAU 1509]|uniref:YceI family protein n=1 Tax=Sinimarinibacterium sp. CAU 1509 TaxID=2562283 RepID=UPI00146DDD71|nr:YceI family protein [Sinimarinibacterium sp. CAU 1509]